MEKPIHYRPGKKSIIAGAAFLVVCVVYFFCLPPELFQVSYSTLLLDKDYQLLNAAISADGQWRFPPTENTPDKFKEAIIQFEDKRFFQHPGVDPLAILRAVQQNVKNGKTISGGSTLSMQVIRLAMGNRDRTFLNKCKEIVQATRLELRYSKKEIMALYASHAPFGGNVVGVEAACWRYFGRQPDELSWGEAALLAVLPNNPSLINLSRQRERLKEKRDRLLGRLLAAGKIDTLSFHLAVSELIPDKPMPLPQLAPHLMSRAMKDKLAQQRVYTTIHSALQTRVIEILQQHHVALKGNQIFNAAAMVMDVRTGATLAYVGNVNAGKEHHENVDVINAMRSTGSILKPFLYAAMQDEGMILPGTLMPDIPTVINGFSPRNFSRDFDGMVPADKALIRSLNIPAVHALRQYRYEKFYDKLKEIGVNTLHQPADHYGLSMILGGAEASLWKITGTYASMARTLDNYFDHRGANRYAPDVYHDPYYSQLDSVTLSTPGSHAALSAGSIWLTFEALKEVYRPGEETGWRHFQTSRRIAWKTGTSFGFRDGWAVGVTPEYAVGVWVGNADGEGRPGLTGTDAAAPILFDIFSRLPGQNWFSQPKSEMVQVAVCQASGSRASSLCDDTIQQWIVQQGQRSKACVYHKKIHLNADRSFRVNGNCEALDKVTAENWFVLPPVLEHYYKQKHAAYRSLPPFRKDCQDPSVIKAMDLIYPRAAARIFIPRTLNGESGSTIFEAAHRNPTATVYWHLDGQFIGATSRSHRLPFTPAEGRHELTLVDQEGETLNEIFQVISSGR